MASGLRFAPRRNAVVAGVVFAGSLSIFAPSLHAGAPIVSPQPKAGAPLAGLSAGELERFFAGRARYTHDFTVAEGLGPVFNKESCGDCHVNPTGGPGSITVTRFGFYDKGTFDPLTYLGGPLHQVSGISEACVEVIPPPRIANVTTKRLTNSSIAFGLVEAIPDADILAHADPDDLDGDLISGRAREVHPIEAPETTRIGRFGWKAQVATMLTFSADAAVNEIGLTNRFFPDENAPNGDPKLLAACDTISDIEDGPDAEGFHFIDRVTDFQRFLGPPPQTPKDGHPGKIVFESVGCVKCHVESYVTADLETLEPALRNKVIKPYTDFLLHDMGALGDGIEDGGEVPDGAGALELRTPALWNVRTRDPMLHDGRAAGGSFTERLVGPDGAITWHTAIGSEARPVALAFFALPQEDKDALIAFLDTLGRLEFDDDGNGEIKYADFLGFQSCFGQTGVLPAHACAEHDIDQDQDVDVDDFVHFLEVYEDPNRDCDGDGVTDLEEILLGAPDADGNGIPDTCVACDGDLNDDGTVDGADITSVLGAWQTPDGDANGDGNTDGADITVILGNWGPCR